MSFDIFRFIRLTLSGLIAGIIIWAIFNPSMLQQERSIRFIDSFSDISGMIAKGFLNTMLLNGVFAAMLGGLLVPASEISWAVLMQSDGLGLNMKRTGIKAAAALGAGALIGGLTGLLAQFVFSALNLLTLGFGIIFARGLAWSMMGVSAGLCTGYALGGWKRSLLGVIGGATGGFVGGVLFDPIAFMLRGNGINGSLSRFVGFTVMGVITGAAVAFVEEIAKQSWVTVMNGPKEGRSFILTKPQTIIGKDEMVDIPLFGDPNIAMQHACLTLQGPVVSVQAAYGTMITVNGAPVQTAQLKDWDTFTVGRYSIRFHQKGASRARQPQAYAQQPVGAYQYQQSAPQPVYSPSNRTMMQAAVQPASGNLVLSVISGPHLNQRFQFGPGTVRIGREAGCAILLAQDTIVSRNHAEISWDGTNWTARDLGSTNGLWINNVRVPQHTLNVGDQIGVGQTWLRVESV